MKKISLSLFILLLISCLGFNWPFAWLFLGPNTESFGSPAWAQKEFTLLKAQANNIDDQVLQLSLKAYVNAQKKGYARKKMLTVIDYSKPSTDKRLWVFDIKKAKVVFNTFVSHGKNSGELKANSFSNQPESLKSSFGVFVTANPYQGKNGYSLRLRGLEKGVNDLAYERAIVIHGAAYVNTDNIATRGQLGRSFGCPAVSPEIAKPLIDTIKESSLVFAYYPDHQWLARSPFLTA